RPHHRDAAIPGTALVSAFSRAPAATVVESKHSATPSRVSRRRSGALPGIHTSRSGGMETTAHTGQLFGLAQAVAGASDAADVVSRALPLLREIAVAEAVLVLAAAEPTET